MTLSYYRKVRTTAKGRWYGKKLMEIAEELGNVHISGNLNHTINPKDFIEYTVHVHEPAVPVLPLPESIIYDCPDFMVINKPSGIPVHPTVNYFHNSVTEILKLKYGQLLPCYRLDRLTSGVLILGKTADFVSQFNKSVRSKRYLARVNTRDIPEALREQKKLVLKDPIITYNGKRGYLKFLDSVKAAKPAETHIELKSIQGELSTLIIEPLTGRTHQIRKHLALHGMPIHNDELYVDNGLFAKLCREPTEKNFEEIWEFAENARKRKMTGSHCAECGVPLYNRQHTTLDLHCAEYMFNGHTFSAPAPFQSAACRSS